MISKDFKNFKITSRIAKTKTSKNFEYFRAFTTISKI